MGLFQSKRKSAMLPFRIDPLTIPGWSLRNGRYLADSTRDDTYLVVATSLLRALDEVAAEDIPVVLCGGTDRLEDLDYASAILILDPVYVKIVVHAYLTKRLELGL